MLVGGGLGGINESASWPKSMMGISDEVVATLAMAAAPRVSSPPQSAGGTCDGSISRSPKEGGLT